MKIHEGLAAGRVLFHRFEQRTEAEVAAQQEGAEAQAQLRAERRRQQEENVRRKAAEARREQLAKEVRHTRRACCGADWIAVLGPLYVVTLLWARSELTGVCRGGGACCVTGTGFLGGFCTLNGRTCILCTQSRRMSVGACGIGPCSAVLTDCRHAPHWHMFMGMAMVEVPGGATETAHVRLDTV